MSHCKMKVLEYCNCFSDGDQLMVMTICVGIVKVTISPAALESLVLVGFKSQMNHLGGVDWEPIQVGFLI